MRENRDSDASPASPSGAHIGQILLRRKWLILFLAGVGTGLGYLFFTQQPPVFQSAAQLLVTYKDPALGNERGTPGTITDRGDDLVTQCVVATSPVVLAAAVEQGKLHERLGLEEARDALALISGNVVAVPAEIRKARTEVMQISYSGSTPDESLAVVEAVVKAYQAFLGQSGQDVSKETLDLVAQAKDGLTKDLERLQKEYADFRAEQTLLGQGENAVNPHSVRITELEAERTILLVARSKLQSRIDSIKEALANSGNREALALMVDQLKQDRNGADASQVSTTIDKLFPLLIEKELLTQDLGAHHPKVVAIDKQITLTRDYITNLFGGDIARSGRRDLLDVYLESLKYEIEALDAQEAKVQKLMDDESVAAKGLEKTLAEERRRSDEIEQKKLLLGAIVKRLDEMSFFKDQRIRTQTIMQPGLGGRVPAKRNTFMAIGGMLGVMLAVGIGYLLEVSDTSFRTPEDIREEIGAPVLGHVPVITAKPSADHAGLSPALSTVHAPKSASSEAFRLVRTSIFFGNRGGSLKVIQVTSPDQGDGKSTVSSNLAVAIAQSGRRTLLIDADMRRPTVHRIFGLVGDRGLSQVIGADMDPLDAIHTTVVDNLSIMPCGKRPANPAELLSSAQFETFLEWARDNFDFVIVDTPPLLAVSDPGNVASRVDGVLLAMRLGRKTRHNAVEARESLDRVGAHVLGVVINGVNAKGEYGYRAAYRYSYNSQYRYGYSYSYGSKPYVDDADRPKRVGRSGGEPARSGERA